jgi:hypothetical protein
LPQAAKVEILVFLMKKRQNGVNLHSKYENMGVVLPWGKFFLKIH